MGKQERELLETLVSELKKLNVSNESIVQKLTRHSRDASLDVGVHNQLDKIRTETIEMGLDSLLKESKKHTELLKVIPSLTKLMKVSTVGCVPSEFFDWKQAVEYMKSGHRVERAEWKDWNYFIHRGGSVIFTIDVKTGDYRSAPISVEDLEATDWRIANGA